MVYSCRLNIVEGAICCNKRYPFVIWVLGGPSIKLFHFDFVPTIMCMDICSWIVGDCINGGYFPPEKVSCNYMYVAAHLSVVLQNYNIYPFTLKQCILLHRNCGIPSTRKDLVNTHIEKNKIYPFWLLALVGKWSLFLFVWMSLIFYYYVFIFCSPSIWF